MEKIIISKINSIILQLIELKKMLHPLEVNKNISFVGDSSDEE